MTGIEERYARSIQSSHLEVTEFAGDIDALIASGWIRDGLATRLYRLRVEFDACDMRSIKPLPADPLPHGYGEEVYEPETVSQSGYVRDATEAERAAKIAAWHIAEKARIAKDCADRRLVAKALALVNMQSLPAARDALGRFVMMQAGKMRLETTAQDELRLAGRILDYLLDPQCEVCFGVKFKTIAGTGRLSGMACGGCDGSGKRRLRFTGSNSQAEVELTRAVLADLERKMEHVNGLMSRFTRATESVKKHRLPAGAIASRPRLGQDGLVFHEVTRDGKSWTRAILAAAEATG